MKPQLLVAFVFFPALVYSANRGEQCMIGDDIAVCTNIESCTVPVDVLINATGTTFFVAGSICGYDGEPLICCTAQNISDQTTAASSNSSTKQTSFLIAAAANFPSSTTNTPESRIDSNDDVTIATPDLLDIIFTSPPLINDVEDVKKPSLPIETSDVPNVLPLEISGSSTTANIVLTTIDSIPTNISPDTITPITTISDETSTFSTLLPDKNTCGYQKNSQRLENISISSIDEFPWVALLRYRYANGQDAGFRCVGTLIDNKHILTAASCVIPLQEGYHVESVRLGAWSIGYLKDCVKDPFTGATECTDQVVEVPIKYIMPHPNYDANNGKDNIAMICLQRRVEFTDFIRPICINGAVLIPRYIESVLLTAGWGTSRHGYQLAVKSKVLLPVLPIENCLNNTGYGVEHLVCIGGASTEKCVTDSGGPAMINNLNQDQWYLEGIIADGYNCNTNLGFYTSVAPYVEWVLSTMEQGKRL